MPVDMSTLSFENFSYYALNPTSSALSKQDQRIAIIATALLSLTLGLGHIVCGIIYAIRKNDFEAGLEISKMIKPYQNYIAPKTYSRSTYRKEDTHLFPEKEIRSFETEARRNIKDPFIRDIALGGASFCREVNKFGESFARLF